MKKPIKLYLDEEIIKELDSLMAIHSHGSKSAAATEAVRIYAKKQIKIPKTSWVEEILKGSMPRIQNNLNQIAHRINFFKNKKIMPAKQSQGISRELQYINAQLTQLIVLVEDKERE